MTTLAFQLDEITASVPAEISERIDSGLDDVTSSGVARGLAVGDVAPDFTLTDAVGNQVVLADLLTEGPVVVTFYRGEWCPYCNLQLRALQEALPEITSTGATLVAISPQAPDHALTMTEKHELAFPVLSDLDQEVSESYKVRFDVTGELEDIQVNVFKSDPASTMLMDGARFRFPPCSSSTETALSGSLLSMLTGECVFEPADVIAALKAL